MTTYIDPNIIYVILCSNNNDNNCNCVEAKNEEKFPPTINKKVEVFQGNVMMRLVVLFGPRIVKIWRSRN
jgi:hypothetical protein